MSSVRYSADNSEIRFNIAGAANMTGAYTLAVVFRRRATAGFQHVLSHNSSGGSSEFGIEFNGTTPLIGNDSQQRTGPTTINNTTDWWILACSRAAGSTTPRWHIQNITAATAMAHTNASGTISDAVTQAGGTVRTGEWQDADDANENMALDGGWNAALSDVDCEALGTNLRTSDWTTHSTLPIYVHEQTDNVVIPDLMANGVTLNVVNGTTLEADVPPGWNFDGLGGGTPAPANRMRRWRY